MGSLPNNIQLMVKFTKAPFLGLLYIKDLPHDFVCNFAICADDATLYAKCEQASDLWKQLELASQLLNFRVSQETRKTSPGMGLLILALEKLK